MAKPSTVQLRDSQFIPGVGQRSRLCAADGDLTIEPDGVLLETSDLLMLFPLSAVQHVMFELPPKKVKK